MQQGGWRGKYNGQEEEGIRDADVTPMQEAFLTTTREQSMRTPGQCYTHEIEHGTGRNVNANVTRERGGRIEEMNPDIKTIPQKRFCHLADSERTFCALTRSGFHPCQHLGHLCRTRPPRASVRPGSFNQRRLSASGEKIKSIVLRPSVKSFDGPRQASSRGVSWTLVRREGSGKSRENFPPCPGCFFLEEEKGRQGGDKLLIRGLKAAVIPDGPSYFPVPSRDPAPK
ncbi:hypothetical protein BaRGS_00000554 [Batillaria attramentaria]|uniref:Uncharacterized protein n=1 Tax=Batillaria attramentaria TaxID=370345 RepID=A0ABD0M9K1_9CAEN